MMKGGDHSFFGASLFFWVMWPFRKPFQDITCMKLETQIFDRMDVIMKLKGIFTKK